MNRQYSCEVGHFGQRPLTNQQFLQVGSLGTSQECVHLGYLAGQGT